jgi:hypothetical protein
VRSVIAEMTSPLGWTEATGSDGVCIRCTSATSGHRRTPPSTSHAPLVLHPPNRIVSLVHPMEDPLRACRRRAPRPP